MRRQLGGVFARAAEALAQLKDTVVRGSQIGKIKLDATALRRDRDRLLQQLGARCFEALEAGEPDLSADAEVERIVARIREVDQALLQQEAELAAVQAEAAMQRQAALVAARVAREVELSLADDKYARAEAEDAPTADAPRSKEAEG